MFFERFYLDQEKDIIVDLYLENDKMSYILSTPNHHTGNLISNLSRLCDLPIQYDEKGYKIIKDTIPCFIDKYNETVYIMRLGGIKIANIYSNGTIDMKASIPSISKTLMSQTKDYQLSLSETIMKSYLFKDEKFKTDLHTHMNANLSGDILIALGIYHQIRYPLYYIKKLGLKCSERQRKQLEIQRENVKERYKDSSLTGKYLDRKIDDHTYINFCDFILNNPYSNENIPIIRASLSIMKDGQAVFTNIEKVYLYRYVFTKGIPSKEKIEIGYIGDIPDKDIQYYLRKIIFDHYTSYPHNTLFQDKLLWIARSYEKKGIEYVEISDTSLVKETAYETLSEIHEVMPQITKETGVTLRFLAGIRRIPLTIIKDKITPIKDVMKNLQVLRVIAIDPYVAGSDILGEEINDIRDIAPVIKEIVSIAKDTKDYVIRIHAGESDSLKENVSQSIKTVISSLDENQTVPHLRIGHGLYTSNFHTLKGKELLEDIKKYHVVLEFQLTSNVRLNNLSTVSKHPLRHYLDHDILCVQGTDGSALYGTDSIDEEIALINMLKLSHDDVRKMREAEERILDVSYHCFKERLSSFPDVNVSHYYKNLIEEALTHPIDIALDDNRLDSLDVLSSKIEALPEDKVPIIVAGGSFNNDHHKTTMRKEYQLLIDDLLKNGDPEKMYFVVGPQCVGYENYLLTHNTRFDVYAFVPATITKSTYQRLKKKDIKIRIGIEPVIQGLYKSIAYEIFKQRFSILLALDGNTSGAHLIQEARNGKYECRIFVNPHSKILKEKANNLTGYITMMYNVSSIEILKYVRRHKNEKKVK